MPPEEDQAMAMGNTHKKFGKDRMCISRDMLADRQTHRHTRQSSQHSSPLSLVK